MPTLPRRGQVTAAEEDVRRHPALLLKPFDDGLAHLASAAGICSALKHGVSNEDALQAAEWSQWAGPPQDDGWPHRELRLGFDTQARLLETVVLIFDSGEELAHRAMSARKQQGALLP